LKEKEKGGREKREEKRGERKRRREREKLLIRPIGLRGPLPGSSPGPSFLLLPPPQIGGFPFFNV